MKVKLKIRLIRLTLCLLAFGLTIGFLVAQPQNEFGTPFLKNYTSKLYKGFPQIFGVTQDSSGIVYFTGNGIVEYDGETWRKIPPLGAVTWSIVQGNDGKIYVGGTDDIGYLEPDSIGQQQFISFKSLLPKDVQTFGQLRQSAVVGDDIYFASKTGYLIQYNCTNQKVRTWKKEPYYTILGNVNEVLYLQVPEEGISKVVNGAIQNIEGGDYFTDIRVSKVLPHDENGLLVCTRNKGLFVPQNDRFIPFQTEADAALKTWLFNAAILPDKTYAISIIDQGIVIVNQNGEWLHHITKSDGLQDNIVLSIHSSPTGTLWLGTNTGLSQIELLSPFSKFTVDEDKNPLLLEDVIRFDNTLYAASGGTNGFLHLDRNGQIFRKVKDTKPGQAFSLSKITNQLQGSGSQGIYQIKGDRATRIFKEENATYLIFREHESKLKKNHLFLGLQKGITTIYKEDLKWVSGGKLKDIPSNVSVRSFIEQEPGQLWIGTVSQGLWRIDYEVDTTSDNLKIKKVNSFEKGSDQVNLENTAVYLINNKLTITGGGGIYNFEASENELSTDERFPLPIAVKDIQKIILAENEEEDVYAHFLFLDGSVELGIYKKQENGNYIFDSSPFSRLPKDELINVSKIYPESNGVIWIAGQNGLYRYDSKHKIISENTPIKIRSVKSGEDSLLYAGHGVYQKPVLEYSQNDIHFHFLETNLRTSGKNQYQTQLKGFDKTWSNWSTKMDRSYTNLPEGAYTFVVRGQSIDGSVGNETSYAFEILPPWWRTWIAYILYAILGFGAVTVFSRWRNRRLRKQREHLQQTVKERTQEIEQRVEELSVINSLQQGLVALMNTDDIYKLVGDKIQKLFKADIAYIAILKKEEEIIHFPYGHGDDYTDMKFGEGLTSQILSDGKALLINKSLNQTYEELGINKIGKQAASYLGVPINIGKEVIGVISVQSSNQTNRFKESDKKLLGTIAAQVGVALHNAQLFKETEKARAHAEEANAAKSNFLSTVSHELRTPLTSVIGFAKIIKKKLVGRILPHVQTDEPKTQRAVKQVNQNLDVVISEGERLTTLINTVLDLAKIEAGRLDWNIEKTDVAAVIQQSTAATSSLFEEKSIPLILEIDENLPLIDGDKDRLIQVVINLISNAIKFTDEGEVRIRAYQRDDLIFVEVKDSGIGISQEDLPKVFEKFKQVGDTLTDKPKGTGLGLPICKEIIDYHKGHIWAASIMGEGSMFVFSLPVKSDVIENNEVDDATPVLNKVGSANSTNNSDKTILIVDDEPSIRSLLRQEISEQGYQIREAVNGKEALNSIQKNHPDLIILDVMMPEMNGFELAAILKNDSSTVDIPIIIVSIVDDQQKIQQLGIDKYLTKPIDMNRLLNEIALLLGKEELIKVPI